MDTAPAHGGHGLPWRPTRLSAIGQKLVAIMAGADAEVVLEALGKMKLVGKTALGGNGGHGLLGQIEKLACASHSLHLEELMRRLADLLAEEMRETGNGQAAALRELAERDSLRQVLAEIIHRAENARVRVRLF